MKAEDIYLLRPEATTEEMIRLVENQLRQVLGAAPTYKQMEGFFQPMLEMAQEFYRLGAFNMEHRDGAKCQAEDQGGWPCCGAPAEFYVKREHLSAGEEPKSRVYCWLHRDNRFYSPEHMSPIYQNPRNPR